MNRWTEFNIRTATEPPWAFLVSNIGLVQNLQTALDLGGANMRNANHLAQLGVETTVVDASNIPIGVIQDPLINFIQIPFEECNFPINRFDLINSSYSLFFVKPKDLVELFSKIFRWLKPGGIFCFNLLGQNDDWRPDQNMNFQSPEDIKLLCQNFEIITLEEQKYEGVTVMRNEPKNWHTFNAAVQKPNLKI